MSVEIKGESLSTDVAGVLTILVGPGGRELGKYAHLLSFDPAGAPYSVELQAGGGLWIEGESAVAANKGVEIRALCTGIRVTAAVAGVFDVHIRTGNMPGAVR